MNSKKIGGSFYEKELQKTNHEKFGIERVIERKSDKLNVKWKGYDNSFNSWIKKKDIEWNFFVWKWANAFLNHLKVLEEI